MRRRRRRAMWRVDSGSRAGGCARLGSSGDVVTDAGAIPMTRVHEAGFFVALVEAPSRPSYKLNVHVRGESSLRDDPYRFASVLTHDDLRAVRGVGPREVEDVLGARCITHE